MDTINMAGFASFAFIRVADVVRDILGPSHYGLWNHIPLETRQAMAYRLWTWGVSVINGASSRKHSRKPTARDISQANRTFWSSGYYTPR